MKSLKNILLFLVILVTVLPLLQEDYHLFRPSKLDGFFFPAGKPKFRLKTWKSGEYQAEYQKYIEDGVAFRSEFVRLFNQVDYSFFSLPHGEKIIIGKDNYLFGDYYMKAFQGVDFLGKDYIGSQMSELKKLQDYLWSKKKIFVLVVFAPDKGTFYPEYIPEKYKRAQEGKTNYAAAIHACAELGVNYIDFNQWFIRMKDTSRYILYPKNGFHWSSYGATLAADSLAKYLNAHLDRKTPLVKWNTIEMSDTSRYDDNDIERTMNLIWRIPQPPLAYPVLLPATDSSSSRPSALVIGDSFFFHWYKNGITERLFSNVEFWYYNKEAYPESYMQKTDPADFDVEEVINRQNVIILLQTNAAHGKIGYGFIDRAWSRLSEPDSALKSFETKMWSNQEYLGFLKKKAQANNISLDEMIRTDAKYLLQQESKTKK